MRRRTRGQGNPSSNPSNTWKKLFQGDLFERWDQARKTAHPQQQTKDIFDNTIYLGVIDPTTGYTHDLGAYLWAVTNKKTERPECLYFVPNPVRQDLQTNKAEPLVVFPKHEPNKKHTAHIPVLPTVTVDGEPCLRYLESRGGGLLTQPVPAMGYGRLGPPYDGRGALRGCSVIALAEPPGSKETYQPINPYQKRLPVREMLYHELTYETQDKSSIRTLIANVLAPFVGLWVTVTLVLSLGVASATVFAGLSAGFLTGWAIRDFALYQSGLLKDLRQYYEQSSRWRYYFAMAGACIMLAAGLWPLLNALSSASLPTVLLDSIFALPLALINTVAPAALLAITSTPLLYAGILLFSPNTWDHLYSHLCHLLSPPTEASSAQIALFYAKRLLSFMFYGVIAAAAVWTALSLADLLLLNTASNVPAELCYATLPFAMIYLTYGTLTYLRSMLFEAPAGAAPKALEQQSLQKQRLSIKGIFATVTALGFSVAGLPLPVAFFSALGLFCYSNIVQSSRAAHYSIRYLPRHHDRERLRPEWFQGALKDQDKLQDLQQKLEELKDFFRNNPCPDLDEGAVSQPAITSKGSKGKPTSSSTSAQGSSPRNTNTSPKGSSSNG